MGMQNRKSYHRYQKFMPTCYSYKKHFCVSKQCFFFVLVTFVCFCCHDTRMLYNLISLPLCCSVQLLYHHHAIEIKTLKLFASCDQNSNMLNIEMNKIENKCLP